jgi:hypothetical protein
VNKKERTDKRVIEALVFIINSYFEIERKGTINVWATVTFQGLMTQN